MKARLIGASRTPSSECHGFIADQFIDVTRVPDGRYLLRVEIDAGRQLLEKTHANNVTVACVELKGESATPC